MIPTEKLEELQKFYQDNRQIGLVLGAGVSKDSGVPLYQNLALDLFRETRTFLRRNAAPETAMGYLENQLKLPADKISVEPDKVIQFIRNYIGSEHRFKLSMKNAVFLDVPKDAKGNVELTYKRVSHKTYKDNDTLNSVITFCSAVPNRESNLDGSNSRWDINPKVAAILTTNYDNLVEGSFGSKYGKSLLKPFARPRSNKSDKKKNVITVYHMHGYISYTKDKRFKNGLKASDLVASENDYYAAFYNHLTFNNIVATTFLRQHSSLFIGCSMDDINLRRVLFQLKEENDYSTIKKDHYALIPESSKGKDQFNDELLYALGVRVIRISKKNIGKEIEIILKKMYISEDGFDENDWHDIKKS